MHTITLEFKDEDQAVAWFVTARVLGAIPYGYGLRQADNCDRVTYATPRPGQLLATDASGINRWLAHPFSQECDCGHGKALHTNDGTGVCATPACECLGFDPITVQEARDRKGRRNLVAFGAALARGGAI